MADDVKLNPGEKVVMTLSPAWRSFWVFYFGAFLVGVGPFLKENAPLSPMTGVVFGIIFVVIILKRSVDRYTVTNQRVMVRGGLIYRETLAWNLEHVAYVKANQGINLRLVSCGHIMIGSKLSHQGILIMYGQMDPFGVRDRIESLAASRAREVESETGNPETD